MGPPSGSAESERKHRLRSFVSCQYDRPRLLASERECQAGDDEGRGKDGQNPLSGAPEGDGFALSGVEGLSSAGVSAVANLEGMTSRFDWYLDRVVHFERSGTLTINHDVVRATSDLDSDCFVRQLQRCGHRRSPLVSGRCFSARYRSSGSGVLLTLVSRSLSEP